MDTKNPLDNPKFKKKLKDSIHKIVKQREQIMEAFLAFYGVEPRYIRQVVSKLPDGSITWRVERILPPKPVEKSRIIVP